MELLWWRRDCRLAMWLPTFWEMKLEDPTDMVRDCMKEQLWAIQNGLVDR